MVLAGRNVPEEEPSDSDVDTGVRVAQLSVGQRVWIWWWGLWWPGKVAYVSTRVERVAVTFDWKPGVRVSQYKTRLLRIMTEDHIRMLADGVAAASD